MRADVGLLGRFFVSVLICCAVFPAGNAQDVALSEIQYQEDYDRLQKNSAKVTAYCKNHKSDTLPTAIKNSTS